ncbi:MAG: DUF4132 domain-containing protein [Litorimonas sp.]
MFWKRKAKKSQQKGADASPNVELLKKFNALYVPSGHGNYYRFSDYKGSDAEAGYIALDPKDRPDFLIEYVKYPPVGPSKNSSYRWNVTETFGKLLLRKAEFTPSQIIALFHHIKNQKQLNAHSWPLGLVVTQLEKAIKKTELSQDERDVLGQIAAWKLWTVRSYGADLQKAHVKLAKLLGEDGDTPAFALGNTHLSDQIRSTLNGHPDAVQEKWNRLFNTAASANGSKPTKKIEAGLKSDIENLGKNEFRESFQDWANWAAKTPNAFHDKKAKESRYYGLGQLHGTLQNMLKGLVWGMAQFHDEKSLAAIAALAEKCFERIKGIGPAAPALGNACIYTLSASKGLSGVAHLSRLKLRIKQNNTQKLIQKKIDENAERLGLKSAEIEEMAAPDFGLALGLRDYPFKDYTLQLDARRVGEAKLSWIKPDGAPQKSVPSFVKESETLKTQLTAVRTTAKNIKKASTAQRDRIDRLYTEDMSWTEDAHRQAYLDHGLVSAIARALIWQLEISGKKRPALHVDGHWQDVSGKPLKGAIDTIRLWHPIMDDIDTIMAWRDRLETLKIVQPMKQAHREVYILTDAEITTRIYSNRMAAHIVRQHQMNVLMATRGWSYSLLGAYDDGRDGEIAMKPLPAYDLTAQFWIDILNDEEDNWNDSGIYHYVATDQVRFTAPDFEGVPLVDIPPIVLSEILRDADLFVGVGSIGNDPTWTDRDGEPRHMRYWQSFAFGDLNEAAKTRQTILERLLPRLKIRDIAEIDGKFLRVQGKRHIYKIHIGSGNIQIATRGDRYLCIVPGRGKARELDNLYLPFEGDRVLSIIISKAFMLADEDKIKDTTILSQLK